MSNEKGLLKFVCIYQDGQVFKQIVKDVFHGLPDPPPERASTASGQQTKTQDLEIGLQSTCIEHGLVPHKPFIEKCLQLHNVASVHQGKN